MATTNLRRILLALFAIATSGAALSANPQAPAPTLVNKQAVERPPMMFLGIVEVPRMFGTVEESFSASETASPRTFRLPLQRTPQRKSPVVAFATSADQVEAMELAHNWAGVSVFGRANGWSLVRLRDGRTGWLSPQLSGKYHAFEQLIREHSDEMLPGSDWNGELSRTPEGVEHFRTAPDPRRSIVGYLRPTPGTVVRIEPSADSDAVRRSMHPGRGSLVVRGDGVEFLEFETGLALPVFEGPTRSAKIVSQVENQQSANVLETLETEVDLPARVIVFSRRPGWFEVGLRNEDSYRDWRTIKKVWIEDTPEAWSFHAVTDQAEADTLVSEVWQSDGLAVKVKTVQRVGGTLWMHVQVLADSACLRALKDISDPPIVLADGWMQAHDSSGQPVSWFETYCD